MKHDCPICSAPLKTAHIDKALPAHRCLRGHGLWLSADEYFAWNNAHVTTHDLEPDQKFELPYPISDNNKALTCPDCRRFLRRYQVWPNATFYLDRCSHCYGVWFDENEWQTLEAQDLHKKLHLFFSDQWQEILQSTEMKKRFKQMYLDRFGEVDYEKIKQLREWFHTHPQGFSLLAYVTDKDPYSG